jgi:ribonuclease HII
MEELEKLSLLKKEYKDIKVDYHYDIKKVQKEGFIALSEIPQKVNDELKTKLISSKDKIEKLQEEKGILSLKNRYILEFIDDSLSKNKMVVIDGDDLLKELKREDIKIHFEPKADSKYSQVSLASIFSKAKQLEGIEKNVLELTSYVSKIKNTKLKSTLENLIHEIKNSKGYLTPKHIKTLEKVSDIETIPENIVSYLENIYRKNEKTTPLFKKISKNLKNISDNEIIL